MNIVQLKEKLYNNPEYVEKILDYLGFGKIKYLRSNNEIRSAIDKEPYSNPNSIRVKLDKVYVVSFSDRLNFSGDIIALVQYVKGYTLNESIKIICKVLGLAYSSYTPPSERIILPFGGYWNGIKPVLNPVQELKIYDESILDEYYDKGNFRFYNDGINWNTQNKFKIRYDLETDRICVGWRNCDGDLVGVMGRYNADTEECDRLGIPKWLPLKPFPKSQTLYGYSENYYDIQKHKTIVITESEKGVMQLDSMKLNIGLAIGSHSISDVQRRFIRSCDVDKVIIAFDEDIPKDWLEKQANELVSEVGFFNTKVGYIYDKYKEILKNGSKHSPTDLGKNAFVELLKNHITWIN